MYTIASKKSISPTLDKKLKNLRYYQNKAIDFSKRNRLLKFPKKATSIEFDVPFDECSAFFGNIGEMSLQLFYKAILRQDELNSLFEEDSVEAPLPKTNIIGKKLITQLDKLRLQAKNNFDSHGLHTLFITIGEIRWKEELAGRGSTEAISDWDYVAPLLLIPVEITVQKVPAKKIVVSLNDELYDIQINPVLDLFIKQELELKLPVGLPESFDKLGWDEIESILKKYQKILKEEKGLDCTFTSKIRLGQFTFHGQQIYEDLVRNEEAIIQHDFISSLCGDDQIIQVNESIKADDEEYNVDDFLTKEEDFTILDADESQLRSIRSVVSGKSLVIHGPPGTGKSQTIVNLISNLLARGQKVLFVCEKQVALNAVYSRLQTKGADISDLCLPLFQYTTDKKNFAKSIIESRDRIVRSLEHFSSGSVNNKLFSRTERIEALKKYSEALLSIVEPLNKTVYWIHGELARVAPSVENIVFPWRGLNQNEIDFVLYQKINSLLSELMTLSDIVLDNKNSWADLRQQSFSPDYRARLFAKIYEFRAIISSFPDLEGTIFGSPSSVGQMTEILDFSEAIGTTKILTQRLLVTKQLNLKNLQKELTGVKTIIGITEAYQDILNKIEINKIPSDWTVIDFKNEIIRPDILLGDLIATKAHLVNLRGSSDLLYSLLNSNAYANQLGNLAIESFKKYEKLFYTDPLVQKIKDWDERLSLYEARNSLKQIKAVYDQLMSKQDILNEWTISVDNIDQKLVWEIEERFLTQYKYFFRILFSEYKKDLSIIRNWCIAHRPKNINEYRKIIIAVADKIRLQASLDRLTTEFIKNHLSDQSIKNVPVNSLLESTEKIIDYLELMNAERINSEVKNILLATELFNDFKKITSLSKEVSEGRGVLNPLTNENTLRDDLTLNDFLKILVGNLDEMEKTISIYEQVASLVNKTQLRTIADLNIAVKNIDDLKILCDRFIAEKFDTYTNCISIKEIFEKKGSLDLQILQIDLAIRMIGKYSLAKDDFYKNLDLLDLNINSWEKWMKEYIGIKTELQYLMNNNEAFSEIEAIDFGDAVKKLDKMLSDPDGLERWIQYQRIRGEFEELKMSWLIDDLKKPELEKKDFSDIFIWSFLNKKLSDLYQENKILKNFNVADYTRYIAEFKQFEGDIFEANQYRVLDRVYSDIRYAMNNGGSSERVLIRESQKVMRHIPIRKLVMENAQHLLDYKPCWMMSPLTLSSYIPFGAVEFDVVIFDEASQMKIENAIGAIGRARQVVVIGDEHQLPPTAFFDVSTDENEEEEMEETGYESILQSSIAILPGAESYLTYHYRSKHPDLIAFSNAHIYKNLTVFPSPKDYEAVKFEFVENGIYDAGQTRCNRIEAAHVAELCIKHFESQDTSLGVIAFSKAQEEAIREAIIEKLKDSPHLTEKFDETTDVRNKNNEESSFFIRNLESVQGDQRDNIILSVGYGPDQNGNVFNRFGPINSKGGYRRLNVAITRARDRIICVSSMKFHQMSPSENARGAILLQKFLEYAEKGRVVLEASKIVSSNNFDADSEFEVSVQNALVGLGYQVSRQVGAAGFSIDLAIINPKNQKEFLLGIECDGATYHSSKSARARDRLRQEILERLGWRIYRIWSQHWITHRQAILEDIVRFMNKI